MILAVQKVGKIKALSMVFDRDVERWDEQGRGKQCGREFRSRLSFAMLTIDWNVNHIWRYDSHSSQCLHQSNMFMVKRYLHFISVRNDVHMCMFGKFVT